MVEIDISKPTQLVETETQLYQLQDTTACNKAVPRGTEDEGSILHGLSQL